MEDNPLKRYKMTANQLYEYVLKHVEKQIGSKVTSGFQLDELCKKSFGKQWAGVFPADKIPELNSTQCKAIYNADKSGEPGTHWMALFYDENTGNTYSYDSYGRKLNTDKVYKNVKKSQRIKLKESQEYDAEQSVKEENCGARCCSWLALAGAIPTKDLMKI